MYTNAHSSIGAIILLSIPNLAIALPLAFLSHATLDLISEISYPAPIRNTKIIEGLFLLALLTLAFLTNNYLILIGAFLGNLMDIIDKSLEEMGKKSVFFPHFPGFPVIYQIKTQTEQMVIQVCLFVLMAVLVYVIH